MAAKESLSKAIDAISRFEMAEPTLFARMRLSTRAEGHWSSVMRSGKEFLRRRSRSASYK
jgi:hypothetical protein